MDANQTRFHMLFGEANWSACVTGDNVRVRAAIPGSPPAAPQFDWDERNAELTLQPQAFLFTQQHAPQPPLQPGTDRRGVGADRFGNVYWIDASGAAIRVLSSGSAASSHFWSAADQPVTPASPFGGFAPVQESVSPAPLALCGLAVTCDHYLVAGLVEPRGLLIFDLYVGGPPQPWLWPANVPFAPFDIAPRPGGGVWILDRENRRAWALDRRFNVEPNAPLTAIPEPAAEFAPAFPAPLTSPPQPVTTDATLRQPIALEAALVLDDTDPVAIDVLPDDSFVILARPAGDPFAVISRYRRVNGLLGLASTDVLAEHLGPDVQDFALVPHDFVVIAGNATGAAPFAAEVYVATTDGNQCFAFTLHAGTGDTLSLSADPAFLPMRLFGGKGLVEVKGRPHYDFGTGWVPLTEQKRPLYPEQGVLVTPVLDGREPQCVWHRLLLDALIPPACQVQVWSRAAEDDADLGDPRSGPAWTREPLPRRRGDGSEIPFADPPTRSHEGTWELLFQNLVGRYAQIKLVVSGDGRSTPRLRALRAYYARFSYRDRYLPAVYREDIESASFIERFLANFEGVFTSIEDRIAATQVLLDVDRVPAAALPWLAGWLGVVLDPAWTESKRRMFLRRAIDYFPWRGTARGLTMTLRLALDECADAALFDAPANDDERRYGIRIIDAFRQVVRGGRWAPADGEAELSRRFRAAIGDTGTTTRFPLCLPPPAIEERWRQFSNRTLGFVPASAEEDARWRNFLCSHYADIDALNAAYGTAWPAFDQVPMPPDLPRTDVERADWETFQKQGESKTGGLLHRWHAYLSWRYASVEALCEEHGAAWRRFSEVAYPVELPHSEALLRDWFEFEGRVLAMHRAAHRFHVLLPLFAGDTDETAREARRALAQRIVESEKPAHTVFDVQYYWAMFLVGTARIGHDTQLDVGSRAPQLAVSAILDKSHLGSAYLASDFPPPSARRQVLGMGALDQGAQTRGLH